MAGLIEFIDPKYGKEREVFVIGEWHSAWRRGRKITA